MKKLIMAVVITVVSVVSVLPNTPFSQSDYDYKLGEFEALLFLEREITPEIERLHNELTVLNNNFPDDGFQGLKGFYDSLN